MSGSPAGVFSRRRAGLVAALTLVAPSPGPSPTPSATTTRTPAEVALPGASESAAIRAARGGVTLRRALAPE
ncbi:MAG TPA: hypothetical protein VGM56_14420 [Byssovorax sp.]|jgi:hypothetical protein